MFADIKDFTATTDRLPPAQLSMLLNRYMAEMTTIADRFGGTIDKFIGDAVMVVFGAPNEVGEHAQALQAVRMAMAMQAHAHEVAGRMAEGRGRQLFDPDRYTTPGRRRSATSDPRAA